MIKRAILCFLLCASQTAIACLDGSEPGIFLQNFNNFSVPDSPKVVGGNLTIYGAVGETISINSGSSPSGYCILANTGNVYSVWEVSGITRDVKFIQGNSGINSSFQVVALNFPGEEFGFTDYVSFPRNLTIVGGNSSTNVLIGGDRETGLDEPAADYAGDVEISGKLTITTKNYDDVIGIGLTAVSGTVSIKTLGGDDVIWSDSYYPSFWGTKLTIDTGSGNDIFNLGLESYFDSATIKMGSGDDILAGVNYLLAGDIQTYTGYMESSDGKRVTINMGSGDDISDYSLSDYPGDSNLVHIDGAGDDVSTIYGDIIKYNGGSGDDALTVAETLANSSFNGSTGDDVLQSSADTQGSVSNFENVYVNGAIEYNIVELTSSGDMIVELYEVFSPDLPEFVGGPYEIVLSSLPSGNINVSASYCYFYGETDVCESLSQEVSAGSFFRDIRINTNSTDVRLVDITIPRDLVFKTLKPLSGPDADALLHGMSLDLTGVDIGRNLTVRGQKYNDQVSIKGSTVNGIAKIDTLQNDDDLSIVGSTFNNKFIFNASSGDDVGCIQSSLFGNAVSATFSSGDDDLTIIDSTRASTIGRINLVGGTGIDAFYRHNAFRDGTYQPSGRQFTVVPQSDGEYESCRGF